MPARAPRFVVLAAVLPVLLSIGAPDINGLERAVSKLFRTGPDASVTNRTVIRFDESSTPAYPATFEFTPRITDNVAAAAPPVLTADLQAPRLEPPLPVAGPPRPDGRGALLSSLYVSFVALQVMDVHSTALALDRGARESNPLIAPFSDNTAALIAVKAGTTAGVLFMTDRVRRHNRLASILIMAAANSAYATIVSRNYRIASELRR
jgi:hypothetical protein